MLKWARIFHGMFYSVLKGMEILIFTTPPYRVFSYGIISCKSHDIMSKRPISTVKICKWQCNRDSPRSDPSPLFFVWYWSNKITHWKHWYRLCAVWWPLGTCSLGTEVQFLIPGDCCNPERQAPPTCNQHVIWTDIQLPPQYLIDVLDQKQR